MADQKKTPELFKADLFSSPAPSGLSFGLGNEVFSSPLSLAPALTPASQVAASPNLDGVKRPGSSSPASQAKGKPVSATPPRASPQPDVKATPTSGVSLTELSTVPLDSPPASSEPPPTSSSFGQPSSTPYRPTPDIIPPVGPGWNDPPLQFQRTQHGAAATGSMSEPQLGMEAADEYLIQPLANQPDASQATPSAPPPVASVTPVQQGKPVSNPYRMGGARKPAYSTGGVPAFATTTVPLPPQPLPQPPPTSVPYHVPMQTTSVPQPSISAPVAPASVSTQEEVGVVQSSLGGLAQPVRHHWFYLRPNEKYWIPFSLTDSAHLEEALLRSGGDTSQQVLVPTDGGRYDVDLHQRRRVAVYWEEPESEVRRCLWFYKGETDRWYLPYQEDVAAKLEEQYMAAVSYGQWNCRVEVGGGEGVVMHSHSSIMHYPASQFQPISHEKDYSHPRSVLRGFAEIDQVEQGEQSRIDHLVFVVHGIGAHHDLNFRCLVDCVDDFREVAQLMLHTHRFAAQAPMEGDNGGRVEFLPVHWHMALHGDDLGVDQHLKPLTLKSISRLREFTNSTLLDILFFTSPIYCQTIVNQVAGEMNRLYELFLQRHPGYSGGVSVMGHSLGSCILFDLLEHQRGPPEGPPQDPSAQGIDPPAGGEGRREEEAGEEERREEEVEDGEDEMDLPATLEATLDHLGLAGLTGVFLKEQIDFDSLLMCSNDDLKELEIGMGPRKKLTAFITSQGEKIRAAKERKAKAEAERKAREKEREKQRQEMARQQARLQGVKFVKGVAGIGQPYINYPQLNFATENLFALGSPIGLFLTVRGVEGLGPQFKLPHCRQVFNLFHPFDAVAYRLEPLVCDTPPEKPVLMPHHKGRKRFHLELYETVEHMGASMKQYLVEGMRSVWQQLNELARSHRSGDMAREEPDTPTVPEAPLVLEKEPEVGSLNRGRRIDYVLQEKPIEKLNEYLFALSSHLSYWRSEDTALFILKEVYEESNPVLIKT